MKKMAVFVMVLGAAACVTPPGDEPAAEGKADPQQKAAALPPPIQTEAWNADLKLADQINLLWPASVTNAQLLYRVGPLIEPVTTGGPPQTTPTYLAFDINDGAVTHVFLVVTGSSVGTNLKSAFNSAMSTRTNGSTTHYGGGTGGDTYGVPPTPHPNIDNFEISGLWQQNAIDAAATISSADAQFSDYVE